MVIGVILYFVYGRRRSRLAAGGSLDPATAGERETARGARRPTSPRRGRRRRPPLSGVPAAPP